MRKGIRCPRFPGRLPGGRKHRGARTGPAEGHAGRTGAPGCPDGKARRLPAMRLRQRDAAQKRCGRGRPRPRILRARRRREHTPWALPGAWLLGPQEDSRGPIRPETGVPGTQSAVIFSLYTTCFVTQTSVWGYPFRTPPGPPPFLCPLPIRSGFRILFSDFSRETRFARVPAGWIPAHPGPLLREGERKQGNPKEAQERQAGSAEPGARFRFGAAASVVVLGGMRAARVHGGRIRETTASGLPAPARLRSRFQKTEPRG